MFYSFSIIKVENKKSWPRVHKRIIIITFNNHSPIKRNWKGKKQNKKFEWNEKIRANDYLTIPK